MFVNLVHTYTNLSADSCTAFISVNILKSLDAHVILVPSFSVINEIFVHHYIFFLCGLRLNCSPCMFIVGEKYVKCWVSCAFCVYSFVVFWVGFFYCVVYCVIRELNKNDVLLFFKYEC